MSKEIKPEANIEKIIYHANLRDVISNKVKDILERMCSYVSMKEIINVLK